MNRILGTGLISALFAVGSLAGCATSTGSGGGGAAGGVGGGYGTGATGGVATGGASSGGTGAVSTGGGPTGGSGGFGATGGTTTTGGTGGVGATGGTTSTGGTSGGSSTLPAGCITDTTITQNCNPLNNSGCSGAGEACDLADDGAGNTTLECFPPPNDTPLGGNCSNDTSGPWCQATMHCTGSPGTCAKFCCSASDCGGGTCAPFDSTMGTLGLCQ